MASRGCSCRRILANPWGLLSASSVIRLCSTRSLEYFDSKQYNTLRQRQTHCESGTVASQFAHSSGSCASVSMRHFVRARVPVAWRKLHSSWSIESSFLNEYRNQAFRCEPSSDNCFDPFTGNASVIVTVAELFIKVSEGSRASGAPASSAARALSVQLAATCDRRQPRLHCAAGKLVTSRLGLLI